MSARAVMPTLSLRAMTRLASARALVAVVALLGLVGVAFTAVAAEDFLPPEQAFRFSIRPIDARSVEVAFAIEPGYYLYRDQFRFQAGGATLGTPALPAGKVKFDQTFQKNVETYRGEVRIVVPVAEAPSAFRLVTTSQGCADAGLCYPPMQSAASISLAGFGGSGDVHATSSAESGALAGFAGAAATAGSTGSAGTTGVGASARSGSAAPSMIDTVLASGSFWPVVGAFFVAGLLLSLTPCVLPMLPIVSSIIVGQGGYGSGAAAFAGGTAGMAGAGSLPRRRVSRSRGLALAASYSFGMAIVYTAFGVAAGLAGEGLAAALQNPWVLGGFAAVLIVLALSMFGVYELQLPQAITCRVTAASQRLPAGKVAGVCAMGGVSALIVSPCVAAPLAAALLYLSQTRNAWLGGTALFSLAVGMSVPLLLVGASAGALLPRAGAWMVEVKAVFGVLLLGVALWTLQPVLPATLAVALWGALAGGAALALYARGKAMNLAASGATDSRGAAPLSGRGPRHAWRQAAACLLGLVAVLQIVGAASGATDPLQPLAPFASRSAVDAAPGMPPFVVVRSVGELDAALRGAGRPVMLDFYADWCVSCKEMERFTFTDPVVQRRLSGALLLKADVTANSADDKALLKRFALFGPPGMIFFDAAGQEIVGARLIGYQNSSDFLVTLGKAGL
ncbi:MAG: protein-disulfide reductase DsbD [Caldimonas sp.]